MLFKSIQFVSPRFTTAPSPRLIVTGAVHGNEICGTVAINRIIKILEEGNLKLDRGWVTFIPITNPLAYEKKQRMGDRNLNRNLYPRKEPIDFEDKIANWLCPILASHDVLLDLHSFHTPGVPFAMVGPHDNTDRLEPFQFSQEEEALARCLGVSRLVDGWLETYANGVANRLQRQATGDVNIDTINANIKYGVGTTEYMRENGGYAITLECGQHDDALAPELAFNAILNTMAHLGMISGHKINYAQTVEGLRLSEVTDRFSPEDQFIKNWRSFDEIKANELIATRADGTPVLAPYDGRIVFPNPNALPGQEWFYIAKPTNRFE